MEEKKLICIGCPLGCELCAVLERGYKCYRKYLQARRCLCQKGTGKSGAYRDKYGENEGRAHASGAHEDGYS